MEVFKFCGRLLALVTAGLMWGYLGLLFTLGLIISSINYEK